MDAVKKSLPPFSLGWRVVRRTRCCTTIQKEKIIYNHNLNIYYYVIVYTFHFRFGLFILQQKTYNLIWEHSTTRRCIKQYSDLHSIISIVWVLFKTTLRKPHYPAKIFEIFNKLCEIDININLLQTSIINFFSLIQYCYNLIISRIHSLSNPTETIQNIVISF